MLESALSVGKNAETLLLLFLNSLPLSFSTPYYSPHFAALQWVHIASSVPGDLSAFTADVKVNLPLQHWEPEQQNKQNKLLSESAWKFHETCKHGYMTPLCRGAIEGRNLFSDLWRPRLDTAPVTNPGLWIFIVYELLLSCCQRAWICSLTPTSFSDSSCFLHYPKDFLFLMDSREGHVSLSLRPPAFLKPTAFYS